MNKLLIGMVALSSIAAFAKDTYKCSLDFIHNQKVYDSKTRGKRYIPLLVPPANQNVSSTLFLPKGKNKTAVVIFLPFFGAFALSCASLRCFFF